MCVLLLRGAIGVLVYHIEALVIEGESTQRPIADVDVWALEVVLGPVASLGLVKLSERHSLEREPTDSFVDLSGQAAADRATLRHSVVHDSLVGQFATGEAHGLSAFGVDEW